jgi:indolepyruvate ferredoxin oxidoreductase beta subunit
VEQANIGVWSQAVMSALEKSGALSLELAKCGALVKGYGETSERGHTNLQSILNILEKKLESGEPIAAVVDQVRRARESASTDPTGRQLANVLGIAPRKAAAQPIKFYRKRPV